jgi:formylglycine-generating enzyme required for sulfatase activity
MSWYEAQEYARSLSLGGKNDWRLPTAAELESLLDRKTLFDKIRPDMREEVPFRDALSYWSSTTFGDHTRNAWIVMFDGAYVLSYYKTNLYHVRFVRG